MNFFLGGAVVSLILDLAWLIIFTKRWSDGGQNEDFGEEGFLRGLVLFFSYILFFVKLAVALCFYLLRKNESDYIEVEK